MADVGITGVGKSVNQLSLCILCTGTQSQVALTSHTLPNEAPDDNTHSILAHDECGM